jgi:hypothetical protein
MACVARFMVLACVTSFTLRPPYSRKYGLVPIKLGGRVSSRAGVDPLEWTEIFCLCLDPTPEVTCLCVCVCVCVCERQYSVQCGQSGA